MGTQRRGSEWANREAGEPELTHSTHPRRSQRGEAASLLVQDPFSPVEREAPMHRQSTLTTASPEIYPDSLPCQSIIKHFLDEMTREEMHYILFHPEAWEMMVERSGLDRDEANMLYHILMEELIQHNGASVPGDLSEEEKMFLLCFPLQKHKLEKSIEELHAIADQVDATHKMLSKTSVVASASGTVSSVMNLLSLALAPVTVGGSLMLSVAGLGLGAATAATNVLTSVLESRSNSAARDRASRVVPKKTSLVDDASEETRLDISTALSCVDKCVKVIEHVKKLRAYQMAKANSGFMVKVNKFLATVRVPFWRTGGLQTAVEGSARSMTRGVRVLGAAGAGFLLMQDVKSLLQSWKHLQEGARAETAEELRAVARQLEQELSQLTQCYRLSSGEYGGRKSPSPNQEPEGPFVRLTHAPILTERTRPGCTRDARGPRLGSKNATSASPGISRHAGEPSRRSQVGHRKADQPPGRLTKTGANQEEFLQVCRRHQE